MQKRPVKKPVFKTQKPTENDQRIVGIHAVKSCLLHTPQRAIKLHISDGSLRLQEIIQIATQMGVPTEKYNTKNFSDHFGEDLSHQGVVLQTKLFSYVDLNEFLDQNKVNLCLILDGVEDPRNLGRAARSAFALGAQLLILPKDRSAQITATAEKAAVGCLARLPVAQVTNLNRAIDDLKKAGLWVIGAAGEAKIPAWRHDFTSPTALIIGSEEKGIRPLVREQCDEFVRIPMHQTDLSLNAADAATVLMYEILRQRH